MGRISYELRDRTVLITGAAGGIGGETARQVVARGGNVVLLDIDAGGLGRLADDMADRAWAQYADVTSVSDLEAAVEEAVERFGGIDVVIANAATFTLGAIESVNPEAFERVVEVTFLGVWRTVRAALPHVIASRGFVSLVNSAGSVVVPPFNAPYSASKAAMRAFGDTLRLEIEPRGAGVGLVYFGLIDTEAGLKAFTDPLMGPIVRAMPRRLTKPRPVSGAARAIIRGIEERRRVVVYPRMYAPPIVVADLFQRFGDAQLRRAAREERRRQRRG